VIAKAGTKNNMASDMRVAATAVLARQSEMSKMHWTNYRPIKFLHDNADKINSLQQAMDKFAEDIKKDAHWAMHSCDHAFENAAELKVRKEAQAYELAVSGAGLAHMDEEVERHVRSRSRSTSQTSNLTEDCLRYAYYEVRREMLERYEITRLSEDFWKTRAMHWDEATESYSVVDREAGK
jgi:hypothetical protein